MVMLVHFVWNTMCIYCWTNVLAMLLFVMIPIIVTKGRGLYRLPIGCRPFGAQFFPCPIGLLPSP